MRHRSLEAGFTITELLVAVVIMGIVTAHVFFVLTTQQTTYLGQERLLEAQQDARLVTEFMQTDVRSAGFLVPGLAGIASIDGGAAGADTLCTSDPGVMADASIDAASAIFDRASLVGVVGASASTVSLLASSMDIDGDGGNDFAVDSGVIIGDGSRTHCARITAVAGNVVTFTPPTPAGFNVGPPGSRAVPALIYELTAGGLRRNNVLISTQIENVQVEFGVDTDGDGLLATAGEFPIHDLNGFDPSDVRRVRLSVIARTAQPDPSLDGDGMPAAANHAGTAPDGFLRRRYTADVFPRNL